LQTTKVVEVRVGKDDKEKVWFLNEALLCERCDYFKKAFRSGFAEARAGIMRMPEDDPEVFGDFVDVS
jgi:hypothetical protein